MKKLVVISLLSLLGLAQNAWAQSTATGTFNVVLNLTSKCEINNTNAATGAVISDLSMNYTSFQTTAASGNTTFNVRCTNNLPYTLALDSTSVTDDAVNLAYTLALSAASGTGNGTNQAFTVTGAIASGQAGTCATATCTNTSATNRTRTLTVTY